MICSSCGVTIPSITSGVAKLYNRKEDYGEVMYRTKEELLSYITSLQTEDWFEKATVKVMDQSAQSQPYFWPLPLFMKQLTHYDQVQLIEKKPFISHFQPIIQLGEAPTVFAYEALLRLEPKSQQAFSPATLFQAAMETELHTKLDQIAREVAIKSYATYVPKEAKCFINFLPSTIYNPDFCLKHTFSIVEKLNVDPNQLVFEVVESEKIADLYHLKNIFKTYKRSGMKVALDDLGTGFASIDVLKELQPDYVKIDRHFIDKCDQNKEKQQFIQSVINISKDLGIIVLAEGMETKEEFEYCKEVGVDLAQGYYISKPLEPKQVKDYQPTFK